MPEPSIAAVVVTYNRLSLLQECVTALRGQTRPLDEIIVVNNGSTDGTAAWLASQVDLTVIVQVNLGSSGGQYTGIKEAYRKGHDWIWCMDDDTIPDADALERLWRTPYFRAGDTGFLACAALWSDRQPHPMHAIHPTAAANWCGSVLEDRCIRVTMTSFVGVLIARGAVAAVGLPVKPFFIITDDYEYTDRISQLFKGYAVLDSQVVHKTQRRDGPPDLWRGGELFKECHHARNSVAWLLHRGGAGVWQRLAGVLGVGVYVGRQVLTVRAHPKLFWWFCKGFVFRYRIDPV